MGHKRIHYDRGRIVHAPSEFSVASVNSLRMDEFTLFPGEFITTWEEQYMTRPTCLVIENSHLVEKLH
jgi:hypothetical protein